MTDHPETAHPDFEALSAFVDGEGPDAADHVASCARCRSTVADIRAAVTTMASTEPGARPSPAQRDAAVAAAVAIWTNEVADTQSIGSIGLVGAVGAGPVDSPTVEVPAWGSTPGSAPAGGTEWAGKGGVVPLDEQRERRERRRSAARWSGTRIGSAAAAVVALVVGMTVLINNTGSGPGPDLALNQPAPMTAETLPGQGGFTDAGDLGAVSSLADLQGRVSFKQAQSALGGPPGTTRGAAGSATNTGALATAEATGSPGGGSASASASADNTGATGDASSRAFAAAATAPRTCESEIRSSRTLGRLAFHATLTYQGQPAVVMGFGPIGSEAATPLNFIALSQEGCSVLAEWVSP